MKQQSNSLRTGGQILVDQLAIQGVGHVFCVPGESYLAVLDAHRDAIKAVAMRPTPGGLVPDPEDQARHDRELADHAAKVTALRQAVTEGK